MIKYSKEYIEDKTYSLYIHIFPNGKMYIGITCTNPYRRWKNGSGYNSQPLMRRAIAKYGWDNIRHIILYRNLDYDTAIWKEKLLIKLFNTNSNHENSNGYNCDDGGEGAKGHKVSEETREKMKKAQIKSAETREKMSRTRIERKIPAWNKGKKMSDEWKQLHPNKSPIRWKRGDSPCTSPVEYNGIIYPSKKQCWEENFYDKISYDAFKACLLRLEKGGKIVKKEYLQLHLEDVKKVNK